MYCFDNDEIKFSLEECKPLVQVLVQRCKISVHFIFSATIRVRQILPQARKLLKNTSKYGNVARIRLLFRNLVAGASALMRINVFCATFLPGADFYL